MNDEDQPIEKSATETAIAYLQARRALNRSQLPSVINLPNGAYIATALVAVAAIAATAWRPAAVPAGIAIVPAGILLAAFCAKTLLGILMLREGLLRWRRDRKEDGP